MKATARPPESWFSGDDYERYVGRWSRIVARDFVQWLPVPRSADWLDVGCGTGALTQSILDLASPALVIGIDRAPAYVEHARTHIVDARAHFRSGDAMRIEVADASFDAAVSGLVLNFVRDPSAAVYEMRRVARPGGIVAAYVWDYASQMQLIRVFWDVAAQLDPDAFNLHEGRRFADWDPDHLRTRFEHAGLAGVVSRSIVVPTFLEDFDDYWRQFLGGQGPAASYAVSLDEKRRAALREALRGRLPVASDGSIALSARAWAVQGRR